MMTPLLLLYPVSDPEAADDDDDGAGEESDRTAATSWRCLRAECSDLRNGRRVLEAEQEKLNQLVRVLTRRLKETEAAWEESKVQILVERRRGANIERLLERTQLLLTRSTSSTSFGSCRGATPRRTPRSAGEATAGAGSANQGPNLRLLGSPIRRDLQGRIDLRGPPLSSRSSRAFSKEPFPAAIKAEADDLKGELVRLSVKLDTVQQLREADLDMYLNLISHHQDNHGHQQQAVARQ